MASMDITYRDILWALREDVQVTLLDHDPNGVRTLYLVTRTLLENATRSYSRGSCPYTAPHDHALVLDFVDDRLVINGIFIEAANTDKELIDWSQLVDAVSLAPSFPTFGACVTTRVRG
jgi:hypothetical protein